MLELQETIKQLRPQYAAYINNASLPSPITSNIFSFRNPYIRFQGRIEEIHMLKDWIGYKGVSVWGITGQGGSGKSRLALHLAELTSADWKSVWLDKPLIKALLECTDYNYDKPVLFICDYAAQYETQLKEIIDKMSWTNINAKFQLLERSSSWYHEFRRQNDSIKEHSPDEPIDLSNSYLSIEECSHIIQDFSNQESKGQIIANEVEQSIIEKANELSGKSHSVRCLFLMMITDAYLRGESIQIMNAEALLHNYIEHTKNIIIKQYNEKLVNNGFKVLAFATANGGINWEDENPAIHEELDLIITFFNDRKK